MAIRILSIHDSRDLADLFRLIRVDPYGTRIMVPKARFRCLRIDGIPSIAATILKQEMLSVGADAAIPRDALTGKIKTADCVLFGTLAQLSRLVDKLQRQPFGLAKLGAEIQETLDNFEKRSFILTARKYRLRLGPRPRIMGIMNITPDSFSNDGIAARSQDTGFMTDLAEQMVKDGADIIDIGGESTRPGSRPVSVKEEIRRVIPAVRAIAKTVRVPVSIDTYKPQVARAALDNGASIVNDISGLRDPRMAKAASAAKAAVVIMHMQNTPRTMQDNPSYECVAAEIIEYLRNRITKALDSGIRCDRIIVDPGIGFGKTVGHNLTILRDLSEFKVLGMPILVGTSRKGFIGRITDAAVDQRVPGTIASCCAAVANGAHIVRVHDVRQVNQALAITEAILND
ncbi:MAG TPA: dihydropteroate synthase [Candidatus Omnitrophota bacterium]|nr:dihydropteroate synthase [Candidatus Omnitrophota bacterium]